MITAGNYIMPELQLKSEVEPKWKPECQSVIKYKDDREKTLQNFSWQILYFLWDHIATFSFLC